MRIRTICQMKTYFVRVMTYFVRAILLRLVKIVPSAVEYTEQ
jgi:hypothetical protein